MKSKDYLLGANVALGVLTNIFSEVLSQQGDEKLEQNFEFVINVVTEYFELKKILYENEDELKEDIDKALTATVKQAMSLIKETSVPKAKGIH